MKIGCWNGELGVKFLYGMFVFSNEEKYSLMFKVLFYVKKLFFFYSKGEVYFLFIWLIW